LVHPKSFALKNFHSILAFLIVPDGSKPSYTTTYLHIVSATIQSKPTYKYYYLISVKDYYDNKRGRLLKGYIIQINLETGFHSTL
jgi:hypothetical protein